MVAGSDLAALREPLIALIAHHRGYLRAWNDVPHPPPKLAANFAAPRAMQSRTFPLDQWAVPALPATGDLAHWLGMSVAELDWFTAHGSYARAGSAALRHYRYQWVPKRSGALRLLEIPKSRLMGVQRKILHELLAYVPPHEAAHGFRARHSCLSHARLHTGQEAVLRMDLCNFFASIAAARINAVFDAITRVVVDEGFSVNGSKTRLMRSAQRQALTGLVVNHHPNLRRSDYDRLKAVLHQCATKGPEKQNRLGVAHFREHLGGCVAHVMQVHPARGAKLHAMLKRIDWTGHGYPSDSAA